jgi:hypothetical protein
MQASFRVPDLAELRFNREMAQSLGAYEIITMNHVKAWSVYDYDPEGNLVEVFMEPEDCLLAALLPDEARILRKAHSTPPRRRGWIAPLVARATHSWR